jgi:hypothetical protein
MLTPRDQCPKTPIPSCTGTIQPVSPPEDLSPSICCLPNPGARTPGPERQTRHQAHLFSLTLLNVKAAGTWYLYLVRSDLQLLRADAPNPDSQLKEHFLQNTRRCPGHTTKLV